MSAVTRRFREPTRNCGACSGLPGGLAMKRLELLAVACHAQVAHVLVELRRISSSFLRSSSRRASSASRQSSKAALPLLARMPCLPLLDLRNEHAKLSVARLTSALKPFEPVAPDYVGEHGKAERPEHHEAKDHQGDGGGRPGGTDQCGLCHRVKPHLVKGKRGSFPCEFDVVWPRSYSRNARRNPTIPCFARE
jgi:hypothetical protein